MTEYQEKLKLAQMLQGKYYRLGFVFTVITYGDYFTITVQFNALFGFYIVGVEISDDLTIDELYELNAVLDAELALKA